MINNIIVDIVSITEELIEATNQDIEDVREAKHEKLLERNEVKLQKMEELSQLKVKLNETLKNEFQNGVDIKVYKDGIPMLQYTGIIWEDD